MNPKGIAFFVFCFGIAICFSAFAYFQSSNCTPANDCISRIPPEPSYEIEFVCDATEFQNLIGRKYDQARKSFYPANTNIIIEGSKRSIPLTPNRLTIEIGIDGRIKRIFCS